MSLMEITKYILLLLHLLLLSNSFSQNDTITAEDISNILSNYDKSDYVLTLDEIDCLKNSIKKDVENWCKNPNDTLENMWAKMGALDTAIFVEIPLDTGVYKLDVIAEYKRRVIGGFAGSYPFAETWHFSVPEDSLITAVEALKSKDSTLQVPEGHSIDSERSSYWYHIQLYDPVKNETIYIWTRPGLDNQSSTLALVSYKPVIDYDIANKRYLINKDFWKLENEQRIESFERRVVEPLKNRLNQ